MMLFRGGGVGHKSTRALTKVLEKLNSAESLPVLEAATLVTTHTPESESDNDEDEAPQDDDAESEGYLAQTGEGLLDQIPEDDDDEFS